MSLSVITCCVLEVLTELSWKVVIDIYLNKEYPGPLGLLTIRLLTIPLPHTSLTRRDEYTLLIYLNKEYQPGDLGGTVWYRHLDGKEIIGSVMNKLVNCRLI